MLHFSHNVSFLLLLSCFHQPVLTSQSSVQRCQKTNSTALHCQSTSSRSYLFSLKTPLCYIRVHTEWYIRLFQQSTSDVLQNTIPGNKRLMHENPQGTSSGNVLVWQSTWLKTEFTFVMHQLAADLVQDSSSCKSVLVQILDLIVLLLEQHFELCDY